GRGQDRKAPRPRAGGCGGERGVPASVGATRGEGQPVRRAGWGRPVPAPPAPPPGQRLSLRVRIGWLVGLTVGAAVAFTSLAAYLTVRHSLYQALDDNLQRRAHAAVLSSYAHADEITRV